MTSDRPYRRGRPLHDAVLEVQASSGRQFSPAVVEALVRLYDRGELPGMEDKAPGEGASRAA
jgi:HD-GYP domain-containing protein (c-di-GMP phosphodiesterase class II)